MEGNKPKTGPVIVFRPYFSAAFPPCLPADAAWINLSNQPFPTSTVNLRPSYDSPTSLSGYAACCILALIPLSPPSLSFIPLPLVLLFLFFCTFTSIFFPIYEMITREHEYRYHFPYLIFCSFSSLFTRIITYRPNSQEISCTFFKSTWMRCLVVSIVHEDHLGPILYDWPDSPTMLHTPSFVLCFVFLLSFSSFSLFFFTLVLYFSFLYFFLNFSPVVRSFPLSFPCPMPSS